jgi:hypothetical protein
VVWSLRSWRAWLPWGAGVCALVIASNSLHALDLTGGAATAAGVATIALELPLLIWLPFLAFNLANVKPDGSPARLRPHWPGWRVAAIYLAVTGLIGVIGSAIRGAGGGVLGAGFALVFWIPFLALETTVSLAWLGYLKQVNRGFGHVWSAPAFRTVILQDLRLSAWFFLGVGGPVLVVASLAIFFVPDAESSLAKGQALPPFWETLAVLRTRPYMDWVNRIPEPFEWFAVAAYARLLVLGFRPVASTAAATPPTHPDCDPASTAPPTA